MDWTHIAAYGGGGAFLLALLQLLINKGPLALGRLYSDRVKREEADRLERREERAQLIELVRNNTEAMTRSTAAAEKQAEATNRLDATLHEVVVTVTELTHRVARVEDVLNLPRPERLEDGQEREALA